MSGLLGDDSTAAPEGYPASSGTRCTGKRAFNVMLAFIVLLIASTTTLRGDDALTDSNRFAIKAAEAARIRAIEKVDHAVAAIYGNNRQGGGSGVVFSPGGFALTNFHVVAGAGEEGWAGLADGKLYRWKLVGLDPNGDLAIIRLTGQDRFPAAPLGDSRRVRIGDWALVMGNPFTLAEDERPTVTFGVVSGVERYQAGSGKNSLVYGNCLQVDASINPGNSGGPLFNFDSEVIGIVGRGSFDERGRVNVGVGYAIASEQILNIIPDLLATKLAQHGTLDAVFGDRQGGVLCEKINLDSKIAQLGLALGDRLIAFDGRPISTANEFLTHICTLPAGWPAEVVFEHDGEQRSAWLRLAALPYAKPKAPPRPRIKRTPGQPQPKEQPEPKDQPQPAEGAEEKPVEEKPADDEKKQPQPQPETPADEAEPKLAQTEPGKIRNPAMNRENGERLLRSWARWAAGGGDGLGKIKAITCRERIDFLPEGASPRPAEVRRIVWSADGRFRVDIDLVDSDDRHQEAGAYGWDGAAYWTFGSDGKLSVKDFDAAEENLANNVQLVALAALYQANPAEAFKELELEGADKAAGQRAFRIRGELKSGQKVYLWFTSETDSAGEFQPRLLKIAAQDGDREADEAWIFDDFRSTSRINWSQSRSLVSGLPEKPLAQATSIACEFLSEAPESLLQRPTDHLVSLTLRPTDVPLSPSAASAADPPPNVFAHAIEYAQQRCVKIYGAGIGREAGYATGLVVSPDGRILTAQGVYLSGQRIRVVLADGSLHEATVERRSEAVQTALLKIKAQTPNYFELAETPTVEKGDWVVAVSNLYKVAEGAEALSVNLGIASLRTRLEAKRGKQDVHYDGDVLLIDAITSNPGAAGGAVVNADGKLVGMIGKIIESTSTNTRLNYAVPADLLRKFLDNKPLDSEPSRVAAQNAVALGIHLFTLPGKRAPAYVDHVQAGSLADKAGLVKDDLILAIDGDVIRNIGEYQKAVATLKPGHDIKLLVKRKREIMRVTLTPADGGANSPGDSGTSPPRKQGSDADAGDKTPEDSGATEPAADATDTSDGIQ